MLGKNNMTTSQNGFNSSQDLEVNQESGCLICAALKKFQSDCLEKMCDQKPRCLCSIHTWLVAKSVDAEIAADTLLRVLDDALQGKSYGFSCEICSSLEEREQLEADEFLTRLQTPAYQASFREHGGLCIPHARRLFDQAPKELREIIVFSVKRETGALRANLMVLLDSARVGMQTHPGVLGRVAEHLVGKRGLQIRL